MELEHSGQVYRVPTQGLILGSDPGCDVLLRDAAPRHAVVRRLGEHMGSVQRLAPNAVLAVNGVAVGTEPRPLLQGDRVQVGPHELLVRYPGPTPGDAPGPPPGARERLQDTLFGLPRAAPSAAGDSAPSPGSRGTPSTSPTASRSARIWILVLALFSIALIAYLMFR
jgi:hypothetical protein